MAQMNGRKKEEKKKLARELKKEKKFFRDFEDRSLNIGHAFWSLYYQRT